jgi:repressor LexA
MKTISNKNMIVYKAIKKYMDQYGYSPSVRDLCELTNLNSPATVHNHLQKLKEFGYIMYTENKSRTIRILK